MLPVIRIVSLLLPFLHPIQSEDGPISFFDRYIRDQDVAWDYLKHGSSDAAWTRILYCNGQFRVDNCVDDGLTFDTLLQLSNDKKAFFMQLDVACVKNSKELGPLLFHNEREQNFFGVPCVQGPGATSSLAPDYDPMRPEFVRGHTQIGMMFNEGPGSQNGYTEENLKEMKRYVNQYTDANRKVYVVYDAYYLTITSRNVSIESFNMQTPAIVYNIPRQRAPDPHKLKDMVRKLRNRMHVDLFLDYEMTLRMYSYVPTVSWIHIPHERQRSFETREDLHNFLHSPRQLIELRVRMCGEKEDSVLLQCRAKVNVPVGLVLQQLDHQKVVLLDFDDLTYMNTLLYGDYPGQTNILLVLTDGPNAENVNPHRDKSGVEAGGKKNVTGKGDRRKRRLEITPQQNVNYVLGFKEAEGRYAYYERGQVDKLMARVPKELAESQLGVRLQMRIIARMNELAMRQAFESLFADKRIHWLFLFIGDPGKKIHKPTKWKELTEEQMMQLRENIKMFDVETYLFAEDAERTRIYEDGDLPIPTWGPGAGGGGNTLFTPGDMTWPDFVPRMGSGGGGRWISWWVVVVLVGGSMWGCE